MDKKLVTIGGGLIKGYNFETKDDKQLFYQTESIDKEIVKLSNKKNPKLLFIGTASKENILYYKAIKNIYENFGCIVDKLEIIGKEAKNCEEFKEKVLTADIIYIGGGNTKFMLSEWNRINLIKILKEAYENGIVMSGFSAGSYCWYKYNYELIEGMGVIPAINCVHYNEKSKEKRKQFYETIKNKNLPGIALDNGTAIEFINNEFKLIKSIKNAKAYKIEYKDNKFLEKEIKENIIYKI